MAAAGRAGVEVVGGSSAADAEDADFVVVVAGLNAMDEGEEYTGAGDRSTFSLDGKIDTTPQNDLIEAVAADGKPMAVVLIAGSVVEMPWLDDVPAVLMAWYPGMEGGTAIGKLLFGEENPGGKLPFTWPKSWNDEPEFNPGGTVPMGYFAGYRYFDKNATEPLFPFGHGMSYTEFEYLNLEVPCSTVTKGGVVQVKVDVSNRGSVAGDEVAFLFVSYPDASDERKKIKQLKSFYRVSLEPNETKQIMLPLRINDLRFYDTDKGAWNIEPGTVEIMVGSSAGAEFLTDQIIIN
jgi:beta-glucosidase